jgi:hypothetical protein
LKSVETYEMNLADLGHRQLSPVVGDEQDWNRTQRLRQIVFLRSGELRSSLLGEAILQELEARELEGESGDAVSPTGLHQAIDRCEWRLVVGLDENDSRELTFRIRGDSDCARVKLDLRRHARESQSRVFAGDRLVVESERAISSDPEVETVFIAGCRERGANSDGKSTRLISVKRFSGILTSVAIQSTDDQRGAPATITRVIGDVLVAVANQRTVNSTRYIRMIQPEEDRGLL